jgi:branched-chain amino acid transport system substrate-binding protein
MNTETFIVPGRSIPREETTPARGSGHSSKQLLSGLPVFSPLRRLKVVLAVFIILIASSAMPLYASEAVRIAAVFSQTGIAATHNEALVSMVQLAVEDINQTGGILKRPIQLIVLDNQSTPIGATVAAEEAARLGVTAVVGAHWSSHSLAMAPVLQKAGIPMISPGSTNPAVTKSGDYIFRACFLDSFQGLAMARFAKENLKAGSAVIVRNIDEEYSVMLAEFFKRAFVGSGGKILLDTEYRGKAVDFADIIGKAKSLAPDVLYLPGYTRDSGLFIKQARSLGFKTIFLGGDAWDEIEIYAGAAIEGSYQSAPWHPQAPFPKSRYLQELYQRKFHKPIANMSAPLAYDAVHLLANAIEQAGSLERADIRRALAETKEFQGATGVFSFDQNGDPENKDVIIIRFQNGQRTFYKTIKP